MVMKKLEGKKGNRQYSDYICLRQRAMKKLTLTLVIPLTIISFALITKWWYVLPKDAPDSMFAGFPFPYVGDGWGSSMSFQYFAIEFIADLLTYFVFWFLMIMLINHFLVKIKPHKAVTIILCSVTVLIVTGAVTLATAFDHYFHLTRDFKMEIMDSGYKFGIGHVQRPEYNKYRLTQKR